MVQSHQNTRNTIVLIVAAAKMFHLPTPRPLAYVKSGGSAAKGVNLAFGGAGVTYAYEAPTLSTQVDELDKLVANGYFVTSDSSTSAEKDISGYSQSQWRWSVWRGMATPLTMVLSR